MYAPLSRKKRLKAKRKADREWRDFLAGEADLRKSEKNQASPRAIVYKGRQWAIGYISPHQKWHHETPPRGWVIVYVYLDSIVKDACPKELPHYDDKTRPLNIHDIQLPLANTMKDLREPGPAWRPSVMRIVLE